MHPQQTEQTIGIIGGGRLGSVLAKQFAATGLETYITSRSPDMLALSIPFVAPGAKATSLSELVAHSTVIILALPFARYRELPPDLLRGKVVIDAMNYWEPVDGKNTALAAEGSSSSEAVARYFTAPGLVKSLNHVAYYELVEHALPKHAPNRRAIALAGDNATTKQLVSQLIDAIGFDTVDAGSLVNGAKMQPDTPVFNSRLTTSELTQKLTS